MILEGRIKKMKVIDSQTVKYYLSTLTHELAMHQFLGRKVSIKHLHYQCNHCDKDIPLYRMGYCKACFYKAPETIPSILFPEKSTAHLGIEQRDLAFEKSIELQPHVVYLADTGSLKVGVTRQSQVPTRWIDQGAMQAIPIAITNNRFEAGQIEVALKSFVSDKTSYQKMLSTHKASVDLQAEKQKIKDYMLTHFPLFWKEEDAIQTFNYPLFETPTTIKSMSLEKQPFIEGTLTGIKGQYWILDNYWVINIRGHEGHYVQWTID